jgi:hypothetical protein
MIFSPLCTGAAAGTGSHSGIRAVGARLVPAQIVDESRAALPLIPVAIAIVVMLCSAYNTQQGSELFQGNFVKRRRQVSQAK